MGALRTNSKAPTVLYMNDRHGHPVKVHANRIVQRDLGERSDIAPP